MNNKKISHPLVLSLFLFLPSDDAVNETVFETILHHIRNQVVNGLVKHGILHKHVVDFICGNFFSGLDHLEKLVAISVLVAVFQKSEDQLCLN